MFEDLINDYNNARARIQEALNSLKQERRDLANELTRILERARQHYFLGLRDFLYPVADHEEMQEKDIYSDFLYLFYDSLKKPYAIHPESIFAFTETVGSREIQSIQEKHLVEHADEFRNRGGWVADIRNSSTLIQLKNKGIKYVPTFFYFHNGRRVHARMRYENCFIFTRRSFTEEVFEKRDRLLELTTVINELKTLG